MRQVHAVVFSKALYGSDGYSNVFLVPSAWLYHSTRFESIERYTLGVVPVFLVILIRRCTIYQII